MIFDFELRKQLRAQGIDPDKATLVDDAESQSANVSDTPTTIQPKIQSSTLGAGIRSFGRGVLPTAAGVVAANAVPALFTGGTSLAVTLPASLIAGIGTGVVASKLQDAAIEGISPELSEQLKADVEQHPVATTVGGILAAGPTFKPSIAAFPGAGRAIRAATTGVPLRNIPAADVGNLFNVGVGATIQPALRLAQDPELRKKALAGDPEALSILGLETLGGSLFNEPTRLGKAVGLHPNAVSEDIFKNAASKHRASLEAEALEREEIPETSIKTKITPVEPGTKSEFESQNLSDIEQMKQDFQQQKIKAKNEADRLKEVAEAEAKAQKLAKKTAERYHAGDEVVAEHFNVSKKAFDTIPDELKGRLRNLYEEAQADIKLKKQLKENVPTEKEPIFSAGPEVKLTEEQLAAEAKKSKLAKDLSVAEEINKAKQAKGEAPLESKLLETKPEDINKKKYSEEEGNLSEEDRERALWTKAGREEDEAYRAYHANYEKEGNTPESKRLLIVAKNKGDVAELARLRFHRYLDQHPYNIEHNVKDTQGRQQIILDEINKLEKAGNIEQANILRKQWKDYLENPELSGPMHEGEGGSKLEEIAAKRQEPLIMGAKEKGIPLTPSKALLNMFKRLGVLRNVHIDDTGRVFKTEKNALGEMVTTEVKGQSIAREGVKEALIRLNPFKQTIETAPHELTHRFIDDMKKFGSDRDKKLGTKMERYIETRDPEYKVWKDARDLEGKNSSVDEYLVTHTGEDVIRRVLKTDGDGAFKSFLKDFWSNVKTKYGAGDTKDFARLLSNRLINEAPFHEAYADHIKAAEEAGKAGASASKFSEEEYPSRNAIIEDREALQKNLMEMDRKFDQAVKDEATAKKVFGLDSPEYLQARAIRLDLAKKSNALISHYQNRHIQDFPAIHPEVKNAEPESSPLDKESIIRDRQQLENEFKMAGRVTEAMRAKYGEDSSNYKVAAQRETELFNRLENLHPGLYNEPKVAKNAEDEGKLPKKGEFFEPERRASSEKAPLSKGDLVDNLREFIAQAQKSVDEYSSAYKAHSEADLSKLSEKELIAIYKNLYEARRKFEDFDARFRNQLPENRPEIRNAEEEGKLPREQRIEIAFKEANKERKKYGDQLVVQLNALAKEAGAPLTYRTTNNGHIEEIKFGDRDETKPGYRGDWVTLPPAHTGRLLQYIKDRILDTSTKPKTQEEFSELFYKLNRVLNPKDNIGLQNYFRVDKSIRLAQETQRTTPEERIRNAEEESSPLEQAKKNLEGAIGPKDVGGLSDKIPTKEETEQIYAKLNREFSGETKETREPEFPTDIKAKLGSFTEKTYNKKGEIVDVERPAANLETNFAKQRIAYQKWLHDSKGVNWQDAYAEAVKIFPLEKPFVKPAEGESKLSEEESSKLPEAEKPRPEAAGKIPGITVVRSVNENTGEIQTEGQSKPFIAFKSRGHEGFAEARYSEFLQKVKGLPEEEANKIAAAKRDEIANEASDYEAFGYPNKVEPPTKQQEDEGKLPTRNPQVDTPEFKKWFGDSKVIDKEGNPLVVYHESGNKNISIFRENSHFGTKEQANTHLEKIGMNRGDMDRAIYPAYISIKNPWKGLDVGQSNWYSQIRRAKELGHDGIIYENTHEGPGKSYIVFKPEQIKSAIGNKGTFDPNNPDIRFQEDEGSLPTKFSDDSETKRLRMVAERNNLKPDELPAERTKDELLIPIIRSEIDAINEPKLKEAFTDFLEKLTENRGKYVNSALRKVRNLADLSSVIKSIITHPLDYLKQDTTELQHVREWFDNNQDKRPNIDLTENETKIRDTVREELQKVKDDQIAKGLNKGGFDPRNLPQTPDGNVIRELQENPRSEKSTEYKEQFLKYQQGPLGKTKEEAKENLATFLKGFSSERINIAEQFAHIDRAEELKIPPEWREKNLLVRLDKFLERVSRRFAYKDAIQSKELVPDLIKEYRANTPVSNVFDQMIGINPKEEQKLSAIIGVIRSGMMGTLTGVKDFVTNINLGMQHQQNPLQTIKSTLDAWKNMSQNVTDSFATGRNRTNLNSLEWSDLGDLTSILRRTRDFVSDIQGRNFLEQMTRATAFGMGRFTTLDFHDQLQKGNLGKQGQKWFKDFGKDIDWRKPELTPEDINKMSARYVDSVQGNYDYRGLPHFAMEGSLSPVLSLARWNIEKANNYMKHVINPLIRDKNPYPFLMSTLGGILGGTAITKLVEEITGRKEKTAKPEEIKAFKEENPDKSTLLPWLYKGIGLASASGYAGMLGDVTKGIMDTTYGRNKPQWYNNVLLEAAANAADMSASLIKSGADNGYTPELFFDFGSKLLQDRLQLLRIILAHTSAEKRDEIERANKFRDLRVYNTLAGNPIRDLSTDWGQRQFGPDDLKKFKRSGDVGEVTELLPQLVSKALDKADGDPEALKRELSKIKRNSYQTMPNPETLPYRFVKYITFLEKSQGKEAASARLTDYITQNELNRAKTAAVP